MGLRLPPITREKLVLYVQELERWNRTVNLTSLKGVELVRRVVVEPAWIGEKLQLSGTLADIGSGNGCPGVALCVARNLQGVHLIEARTKRAAFLRHVVHRLGLEQVVVHRRRVEDIQEEFKPVKWITLQAVSPTAGLLRSLRRIFGETTRVVWITSGASSPASAGSHISVPGSNSEAWVFSLDQI